MMALPKINRAGWLATWLQNRRRARAKTVIPAQPPAPVIVSFQVIDNGGMIDMNIVWTWDGQGWPDDGNFLVYAEFLTQDETGDEYRRGAVAGSVPGPGRSLSVQGIFPAADTSYYCKVQYRKGNVTSAYSVEACGNPY
jgi:hypothetical protein